MPDHEPARRRVRSTVLAAVVLGGAALGGVLTRQPAAPAPSFAASSPADAPRSAHRVSRAAPAAALGTAGGAVPDGVTVFDDGYPAVTNLDPALLEALRRAATDAGGDGVRFVVNSGWRSAAYQDQLLREAIAKYGSAREAARWVATPRTSPHVSGDAVDIGPSAATAWLAEHGAAYGLCQIYRNEPWHYELRTDAAVHRCPGLYADPTHDPRMRDPRSGGWSRVADEKAARLDPSVH